MISSPEEVKTTEFSCAQGMAGEVPLASPHWSTSDKDVTSMSSSCAFRGHINDSGVQKPLAKGKHNQGVEKELTLLPSQVWQKKKEVTNTSYVNHRKIISRSVKEVIARRAELERQQKEQQRGKRCRNPPVVVGHPLTLPA